MIETNLRTAKSEPEVDNTDFHEDWSENPDYFFFWGGACSQWAPSMFTTFGETFNCAEQFMMAAKAKTFGDEAAYDRIMASSDPAVQKNIGRKVANFVPEVWNKVARNYVTLGNYDKFKQNPEFLEFLMENREKFFVEASPYDKVWGIGLGVGAEGIDNPVNWQGTNWLGQCINQARDWIVVEQLMETLKGVDYVASESDITREKLNWNNND